MTSSISQNSTDTNIIFKAENPSSKVGLSSKASFFMKVYLPTCFFQLTDMIIHKIDINELIIFFMKYCLLADKTFTNRSELNIIPQHLRRTF